MDAGAPTQCDAADVKELQAAFFPPQTPKKHVLGSYFSNILIKTSAQSDEDSVLNKAKEAAAANRELFTITRESNFVPQPPRWPIECQVLEQKVRHIPYTPTPPESYYATTGKEAQPKPAGEECGFIVYQYIPISTVNYFTRSSVGGSKYLVTSTLCDDADTLRFESRFESGNLAKAIKITPCFYELYLRSDLYTNRHTQWFYFRVSNMKKNFLYRFSIVNFSKDDSLYGEGMRPLMYSTKDSQLHSIGWRRCGDNISYYCNDNVTPDDPDQIMTYTLTFTMTFPHDEDDVYLANCYPYTYTDLEEYLMEVSSHPVKSTFTTIRLLCKSLAGNNVHHVTITTPTDNESARKKRAIVITGRVHPGETPASWMMKGCLDFLTSDSTTARELRDNFIFKLVPMLNPDGVIVGNNRCSLSAKDLNRQYRSVLRETYPSIWYTKLMVRRLLEECGVAMYCDLHAHSRKHNIFIYGCESRQKSPDKKLLEQVFPLMLHKNTADKFSFESCKFRIQKGKEGTGRVVMWMMGIANSYTMEASFAGTTLVSPSKRADTHFTPLDLEQMGKSFCQTLLDYYDEDPRKICKATLNLNLEIKPSYSSSTDSDDEPPPTITRNKTRVLRKRRRRRRTVMHVTPAPKESGDQLITFYELSSSERMAEKLTASNAITRPSPVLDKRNLVAQQLAEVQARLMALKNKLWFGVGASASGPIGGETGRTTNVTLVNGHHTTSKREHRKRTKLTGKLVKRSKSLPDTLVHLPSDESSKKPLKRKFKKRNKTRKN